VTELVGWILLSIVVAWIAQPVVGFIVLGLVCLFNPLTPRFPKTPKIGSAR
jgi:phosphate/sulfate permease